MLKMVPLSKIKDNPWRNRQRNPVDPNRVNAIEESIDTTEFWIGVYGRELKDGTVEIAFGHHRVDAAKQAGLKEINVEIQPFSNGEMLIRMSRENLRGDLLGAIEVIEAAIKAVTVGDVVLEEVSKDTRKDALRYAPSFVPGKVPDRTVRSGVYTADTVARFLGGVYVQKPVSSSRSDLLSKRTAMRAQQCVHAALRVLEAEERKLKGFSEKVLQKNDVDPSGRYVGAKKVIEYVDELIEREVKVQERAERSAEEIRAEKEKQQALQAHIKEREAVEKKQHDELIRQRMEALVEKNVAEAKRLQQVIKDKAEAAEAKTEADKTKMKALETDLVAKQEAAKEQQKVDEYLPIRRETDRIIHILERRDLAEDLKALSRRALNNQDRERVRQAALTLGTWYAEWVAAQFIPPNSPRKRVTSKEKK